MKPLNFFSLILLIFVRNLTTNVVLAQCQFHCGHLTILAPCDFHNSDHSFEESILVKKGALTPLKVSSPALEVREYKRQQNVEIITIVKCYHDSISAMRLMVVKAHGKPDLKGSSYINLGSDLVDSNTSILLKTIPLKLQKKSWGNFFSTLINNNICNLKPESVLERELRKNNLNLKSRGGEGEIEYEIKIGRNYASFFSNKIFNNIRDESIELKNLKYISQTFSNLNQ